MPNLNLYLKLESLLSLARGKPHVIGLLQDFLSHLCRSAMPHELVMVTIESHILDTEACEIFALVFDEDSLLGRCEKYGNCVYSKFANSLGRVVVVEKAKQHSGYLSLDDRVESEIFVEYVLSESVHFILNAEFSSPHISDSVERWFVQLSQIFARATNRDRRAFPENGEGED